MSSPRSKNSKKSRGKQRVDWLSSLMQVKPKKKRRAWNHNNQVMIIKQQQKMIMRKNKKSCPKEMMMMKQNTMLRLIRWLPFSPPQRKPNKNKGRR